MKRKNAKDYNCWQKPWTSSLNPLKKSNFCDFVKSEFLQSRKTIPLARTSPTLLCDIFRVKRKNEINYNFRQKPWINPLGKIQILRLFQIDVFIVEKGHLSVYNVIKHFLAYFE